MTTYLITLWSASLLYQQNFYKFRNKAFRILDLQTYINEIDKFLKSYILLDLLYWISDCIIKTDELY